MHIVPRIPAQFANMLLAYWASKARSFTFPLSMSCRAIISLLSKAHFAVLTILTNVDTDLRAFRCSHPFSTFELDDGTFFSGVANAIRIASQTKETPFAITRQQSTSPHIIRSFVVHPVQTNPIVQHINSQIKLEVMPTSIFFCNISSILDYQFCLQEDRAAIEGPGSSARAT